MGKQWQSLFSWAPKSLKMVTAPMKLRYLLLRRKAKTNLDSVLKTRDFTLLTKAKLLSSQSYCFSSGHVQMWALECKECWAPRTDVFELWCWRRLLKVPWTTRRSSQSVLKETSPKYSLEGLMLKLKLQYLGHLMQRTDSLEKTLMLGKTEDRKRRGDRGWNDWVAPLTQWTWVWANSER